MICVFRCSLFFSVLLLCGTLFSLFICANPSGKFVCLRCLHILFVIICSVSFKLYDPGLVLFFLKHICLFKIQPVLWCQTLDVLWMPSHIGIASLLIPSCVSVFLPPCDI